MLNSQYLLILKSDFLNPSKKLINDPSIIIKSILYDDGMKYNQVK